jgi:hypothetical protein
MQKNADGREFRVLTPFQVIKSEAVFGQKKPAKLVLPMTR